jgi:acetyl-CoA acyltransferase 1
LAAILSATLSRNPHHLIQDINIGTVLSELGGSKAGRMAALHVGLPPTTAFSTTNRACASSLAAITTLAHSIAIGSMDGGIAGGMESMSRNYGSRAIPTQLWQGLRESGVKEARDCVMAMGLTADNVARRYGISRREQDEFAAGSHQKAERARQEGLFEGEIVEVRTKRMVDPSVGVAEEEEQWEDVTVTQDDGIRPNSSVETLSKMKPAFQADGTATAGNSSQVSDGAAAAVMMRRSAAVAAGLGDSIIGKWAGSKVVGCSPDEMGIGPTLAIPQVRGFISI